jgi:hypothetical protein
MTLNSKITTGKHQELKIKITKKIPRNYQENTKKLPRKHQEITKKIPRNYQEITKKIPIPPTISYQTKTIFRCPKHP